MEPYSHSKDLRGMVGDHTAVGAQRQVREEQEWKPQLVAALAPTSVVVGARGVFGVVDLFDDARRR